MGCAWVYMQKVELHYWWEYGDKKTRINSLNEKLNEFSFGIFFHFQDVIIDAIYADIIHGKLDQKNKQVGL